MMDDLRDRAMVSCAALIGYCHSFPTEFQALSDRDKAMLEKWLTGLREKTHNAGICIEAAINQPGDQ